MNTVLKGKAWHKYMQDNNIKSKGQMQLYSGVTYNYQSIYKIGEYYFTFAIPNGYKNISSLKRLIAQY